MIAALDRLIEPYGGRGAVPQSLQISAWTLENELSQLQTFGFIMPLIFLGVAAFILNVALARALALQRAADRGAQGARLLERRAGLALHQVGAGDRRRSAPLAGVGGRRVARLGDDRPLQRVLPLSGRSTTTCRPASPSRRSSAAWSSRRSARSRRSGAPSRIPPAEAMRPEPPARYRRSLFERPWRRFRLTLATRMILRNLERQPVRTFMSVRRHRVRRRGPVRRPRVHRRHGRADRPAVRRGDAAGRDGELRRAALGRVRSTTSSTCRA